MASSSLQDTLASSMDTFNIGSASAIAKLARTLVPTDSFDVGKEVLVWEAKLKKWTDGEITEVSSLLDPTRRMYAGVHWLLLLLQPTAHT